MDPLIIQPVVSEPLKARLIAYVDCVWSDAYTNMEGVHSSVTWYYRKKYLGLYVHQHLKENGEDRTRYFFVLDRMGDVIGYFGFYLIKNNGAVAAEIRVLYIAEVYRRKRYGTRVLKLIESMIRNETEIMESVILVKYWLIDRAVKNFFNLNGFVKVRNDITERVYSEYPVVERRCVKALKNGVDYAKR